MLTVVVYFNNLKNSHKNFLNNLHSLKQKDVEIIFIVDSKTSEFFKFIEQVEIILDGTPTKTIYSSKKLSLNQKLYYASKQASMPNIMFIDSSNTLNKTFFNDVETLFKDNVVDVLEFGIEFKGDVKWNPKKRFMINDLVPVNLNNDPRPVAYTLPFIHNKIFSTKLIKNVVNNLSLHMDNSDSYSIEPLYVAMINANNYMYWYGKPKITINFNELKIPSFSSSLKEWERVVNLFILKNKFLPEIKYAKCYYFKVFLLGFMAYSEQHKMFSKDSSLRSKYKEKLEKLIASSELQNFNVENKYMIFESVETELLKNAQPIKSWNKTLSLLEK